MKSKSRKRILITIGLLAALTIGTVAIYGQPLVAWYGFKREFETLPVNAQGLPEYKHRQTEIIFVKVPSGTFMMGSPEDEVGREENEGPQQRISLPSFLIGKYEVSQEQWENVMGNNHSSFKEKNLPVHWVSWDDCLNFCQQTKLSLPSEAQWEYACRAGTITPFTFGESVSTRQVNYNGLDLHNADPRKNYLGKTVPVDSFEPNSWGIFNMHGNVYEWCQNALYKYSDPTFSTEPGNRIIRGGAWNSNIFTLRSAYRESGLARDKYSDTGFRPVWNPE